MFKTKRNSFKRKINLKEMKARVLLFSPTYPIIAAAVLLLKCFNCYESVRLAPIRSLSAEILIRSWRQCLNTWWEHMWQKCTSPKSLKINDSKLISIPTHRWTKTRRTFSTKTFTFSEDFNFTVILLFIRKTFKDISWKLFFWLGG